MNPPWNEVNFWVVGSAVYAKFTSDQRLKEMLLATEDRELVEASPRDGIWGIRCGASRAVDRKNWKGQNKLGVVLMEVRDMIYAEEGKTG